MSQAEYEVTISPGGEVEAKLVKEATVQSGACVSVQNLMASLGNTTEHDQECDPPVPVNINLNIPGTE